MDEPEWNAYLNEYANLDATHFTKIPKTTNNSDFLHEHLNGWNNIHYVKMIIHCNSNK
jgi:hypothetical protein